MSPWLVVGLPDCIAHIETALISISPPQSSAEQDRLSRPLSELDPLDLDQDVAALAQTPELGDAVIGHDTVQLDLRVIDFEDDAVVGENPPVPVEVYGEDGGGVSSGAAIPYLVEERLIPPAECVALLVVARAEQRKALAEILMSLHAALVLPNFCEAVEHAVLPRLSVERVAVAARRLRLYRRPAVTPRHTYGVVFG